ncbi:hypothetical protein SCUP515_12559 [Seiridium cupressi]
MVSEETRKKEKEVAHNLKERARKYRPISTDFRRIHDKAPYSKRQLRKLVKEQSLAATKPDDDRLSGLRTALSGMGDHDESFDQVKAQVEFIIEELDEAFFFGVMRGKVGRSNDEQLLKLSIEKTPSSSDRRGAYRQEDNCLRIFIAENEKPRAGKYVGTLAHEMAHAYLFIFAHDFSRPNAPDMSDLGAHSLDWCKLYLFILDTLLV